MFSFLALFFGFGFFVFDDGFAVLDSEGGFVFVF